MNWRSQSHCKEPLPLRTGPYERPPSIASYLIFWKKLLETVTPQTFALGGR